MFECWGWFDIVFNNVGSGYVCVNIEDFDEEVWNVVFVVNLIGVFLVMKV